MLKTLMRATCKSELLQQFRRADYITSLWSNAHMKGLSIFSPEKEGTKDADVDNNDIQYQHWSDDEILNFNAGDNEN
ncbi:hypothetical protein TNCV_3199521 [Trichonephila clavipes]|nr:hypothetical protein TNCV_3199521 [Trichonephila clavipes]